MLVTESERALLHEMQKIKKDPLGKRIIHLCASQVEKGADPKVNALGKAKALLQKSFSNSPYYKLFHANNGDLFVAYSHVTISDVLEVCSQLEKIFLGEGTFNTRNPYGEYAFFKICDAGTEYDKVMVAIRAIIAAAQGSGQDNEPVKNMMPEHLPMLSEVLRTKDMRSCIFNQPVYFVGERVPSIEFLEFSVSTKQIQLRFMPDVNLQGNPWLFHALRDDFDVATLRGIGSEIAEYRHKGFSLNLSLNTALGREFRNFYDQLPTRMVGRIVAEIHKTDMVQNMGAMRELRKLADARGFKIAIDGVDWHDFEVLSFKRLRPDFVKLSWNCDLVSLPEADLRILVEGIHGLGEGTQVVLCRCDDPRAFLVARGLRIRYVQGRLADHYFRTGDEM